MSCQDLQTRIEVRRHSLDDAQEEAANQRAPEARQTTNNHRLEPENQTGRARCRIEVRANGQQHTGKRCNGQPVPDGFLELWQADGAGRYSSGEQRQNTAFKGFGRSATTADGTFSFRTVKPGAVEAPGGGKQAPHINVSIFARGILKRMFTRIYFAGETANTGDPVLNLVPADRRATLVALREGDVGGVPKYVFDVHLQGEKETVFFEA